MDAEFGFERRLERLEKENVEMRQDISLLKKNLGLVEEDKEWKRNTVDQWMIKVVYPGIYSQRNEPAAGFPTNRRKTANQVKPGQKMFMYTTSPIKRIIGLTEVTDVMTTLSGKNERWPFSVPLKWVIGPKQKGVSFEEAGLDIRPRPGDTVYGITDDTAARIIELLNDQKDVTAEQWDLLDAQYSDTYPRVTHPEAVRRLRDAGEHEAANEVEDFRASDGTVRGWDEFASQEEFRNRYPKARSIIWPEEYQDD